MRPAVRERWVRFPAQSRCRERDGAPIYIGRVGHIPEEDQAPLYDALKQAPAPNAVPEDGPDGVVWCDVELECYVRYFPETVTGGLRLARFQGWRGK